MALDIGRAWVKLLTRSGSPWLKNVSNVTSFDQSLQNYVQNTYVTAK